MKVILGTSNPGKVTEIESLLKTYKLPFNLEPPPNKLKVKETGNSFLENAVIKAKAYYKAFSSPVLAEDSGLVIPKLNGEPGIYSARYISPTISQDERNRKLIEKIKSKGLNEPEAYFTTVMVLMFSHNKYIVSEGKVWGKIIEIPRGNNGFGYDPIFYIPDLKKTMAELETEEKNRISHRGQALKNLKSLLDLLLSL